MRRKMLGAILLPLPFAALPVFVVLMSAAFGGGESDELVTREDSAQVLDDFAAARAAEEAELPLAKSTTAVQFERDCGEYDLHSES